MKPDFEKNKLIPCIVQDRYTRNVLMLAYMNLEAYNLSLETGKVTFYSRSRESLWVKGETSGNFLHLHSIESDCDGDTLLIQAEPAGPACHLGTDTCFGDKRNRSSDVGFLENTIIDRKENPKEGSYTNKLLDNLDLASQKVGEESVELIIEAKDQREERFLNEAADLLYHYLVLLHTKDHDLNEVINVLRDREK